MCVWVSDLLGPLGSLGTAVDLKFPVCVCGGPHVSPTLYGLDHDLPFSLWAWTSAHGHGSCDRTSKEL